MAKKDYSKLEKDDLLKVIEKLESRKKYGLIWDEEKTKEQFEKESENALPVLKEVKGKEIKTDPSKPTNILIEGDNYHALSVLNYTHQGKIDVIYIDPPYNTGKKDEFKYNDHWVDKEDSFKHSKWLSFMSKRLRLAHKLLTDTGVILISIDDNEYAQLKLLCNDVFGEDNFIGTFIWRGGKRNASKHISTSHDYIVFYTKNEALVSKLKISWKEHKRGLDEIYKKYDVLKKQYKSKYNLITKALKDWFSELPDDHPAKDHSHYSWVDKNGIYFPDNISRGGGGGPRWNLINPQTGNKVKIPSRGWAFATEDDLRVALKEERIHFSGDGVPCIKSYLKDKEYQILDTVFYKDRRSASSRLRDMMGEGIFDFPKDEDVIAHFIDCLAPEKALVLDFFAGSGTTGHSVLKLNGAKGERKFILVTNNEGGICEDVCYPRLKKVIKGYIGLKSRKTYKALVGNLKYYKTAFVKNSVSRDDLKIRITRECTEMLCLREGIFDEVKAKPDYHIFEQNGRIMGVYYSMERDGLVQLKKELDKMEGEKILYCFTFDPLGLDKKDFVDWKDVSMEAIPQPILDIYKEIYNL